MNELVSYGISILISCTSFLSLSTNIVHNKISSTIIPSYVPPKKRLPWVTYIYSTIHASLSTIFSILYLSNRINQSLYIHMFGFSVGYAIHDALVVWRNKRFFPNTWKEVLVHHSTFIFGGLAVCLPHTRDIALTYAAKLLTVEISTIFLNMSWFLLTAKKEGTLTFRINGIFLLLSYLTSRIANLSYHTWELYSIRNTFNPYISYPGLFIITGLTSMNYMWFYKLIRSVSQKWITKKDK